MASIVGITEPAANDVRDIRRWLSDQASATAAGRPLERVLRAAKLCASQPQAGRTAPELGPEARCYVVAPYLVFYREVRGGIELLRIVDGRRDVPKILQAQGDPDT